ncbi:mediator-associated protein 1-like [Dorcoceras hygrometricum]|uniref:Mediator-associated protein 1-like n=1 Tax=Dorcoceras hygrometricum TaxID=472368 RepID=A0A2Z7AQC2_9LAMI|nr:mediator-associated protein 1-like [Dorcoceras hygrometricum]
MGNTDPNNTKAGKQIRDQASVRRAIKTANHATCYPGTQGNRIDQLALHSVHLGYLKIPSKWVTQTQTTQKQENKYEIKPQYEELSKQLIMQHAIIDAMKCMRAIKGRIAKPVNQLAIHLSRASIPRTMHQSGKSSVRDLQSPSAHHSSMVFRQPISRSPLR